MSKHYESPFMFAKWTAFACVVGTLVGTAGAAFHHLNEYASHAFQGYPWILYCLPLAGLLMVWLSRRCGLLADQVTNLVLISVRYNTPPGLCT